MSTFMTTKQVAELTCLAAQTLEKWRLTGAGPEYIKISPRRVVYNCDTVMAWLDARRRTSTSDRGAVQ